MAFNFPANPVVDQVYQTGTHAYIWNGVAWMRGDHLPGSDYVLKSGDVMTGLLELGGLPTQPMHAVPRSYVDERVVLKVGDTMLGPLILAGPPTLPLEAATKAYVDGSSGGGTGGIGEAPDDGQMYGRKNLAWQVIPPLANYTLKAGDTMTGSLILKGAANQLILKKNAAGQTNDIWGMSHQDGTTAQRWLMRFGGGEPESGSNAGTNFELHRYSDEGAYLGTPFSINRNNGVVNLASGLTVAGQGVWHAGNFNPASYLPLAGGVLTGPLTIQAATSSLILRKTDGSANGTGNIIGTDHVGGYKWLMQLASGTAHNFYLYGYDDAGNPFYALSIDRYARTMYTSCSFTSGGNLNIVNTNNRWQTDGWLVVSAGGQKPGGGDWTNSSSDARVKQVHGNYDAGLIEILQLQPKVYSYLGNDGVLVIDPITGKTLLDNEGEPVISKPHEQVAADGTKFIGLIAQECETVMPEMVTKQIGVLNGKPVDDLRQLDSSALTYALINAVKTLAQHVGLAGRRA